MKKVLCISRNEFFKHHLKIEVGKIYLGDGFGFGRGINIRDISGGFIGRYHSDQFVDLRSHNLEKVLNELLPD